tara:strand:+ start:285 stop:557 length:273 start_codon:yes stop_codon:yes gene_type:complete
MAFLFALSEYMINNELINKQGEIMDLIKNSKNSRKNGIKSFSVMSSKRKRRCKDSHIFYYASISTAFYNIPMGLITIPCLKYHYEYNADT